MEVDSNFTDLFSDLYNLLSKKDVIFINFLLRINHGLCWPTLESPTAEVLLITMMERGLWKVDLQRRECRLSLLIYLLDKVGRRDLSDAVKEYG